MKKIEMYKVLSYSGAIPLIVFCILNFIEFDDVNYIEDFGNLSIIYAIFINAFLAGIHWGISVARDKSSTNLFIASNVIFVTIFVAYVLLPELLTIVASTFCFLLTLYVDYLLYKKSIIDKEYFRMRVILTSIVIVCLGIISNNYI